MNTEVGEKDTNTEEQHLDTHYLSAAAARGPLWKCIPVSIDQVCFKDTILFLD